MATTPPPESISADDQRALFAAAVDMLGGQRETARLLDVTDRTIRDLLSGQRKLHTGFLRDISAALVEHARRCRMVERRLNPLLTANRTAEQNAETPDGRRYDAREDAAHG